MRRSRISSRFSPFFTSAAMEKDDPNANEVVVFKQDGLGRVKTPASRRDHLLDEFDRSGLSGKKFAALAGIKCQTFATWGKGDVASNPVRARKTMRPSAVVGGGGGTRHRRAGSGDRRSVSPMDSGGSQDAPDGELSLSATLPFLQPADSLIP